jgi:hypothetical protein
MRIFRLAVRAAGAALAIAAAAAAGACEPPLDEEPLPCRNAEPGRAELGIGNRDTGFQPLADGEDVQGLFGTQGMHMVIVSVRVRDLEKAGVGGRGNRLELALLHAGEVVGGTVNEVQPTTSEGGFDEFLGLRPVFTVADVMPLEGELVDVEASVTDGCGRDLPALRSWRLRF